MEQFLALVAAGIIGGCCLMCCCNTCCGSINTNFTNDSRFVELSKHPHGESRWKLVNSLHRDYGVSRDKILDAAKRK